MTTEITPKIETPKHLTRTGIMHSLIPSVSSVLQSIPGLVKSAVNGLTFEDAASPRRVYRALLTIGIRMMLDAGVAPSVLMGEAMVAIKAELEERAIKAKENGATQAPADA